MRGPMAEVKEMRIVLTVPDFDEAIRFYRDALGMPQLEDWSSDEGRVVLLDGGRATLELFDEAQAAMVDELEVGDRVSGHVRLAVEVEDSDAKAADAAAVGGELVAEAAETPWGDRNARVRTPDGLQLTLFATPGD